ncbi:MAG TPA: response regulator [Candidatus Sulfotelmatobacter sp.]|nr:response regulator [Candidatus Sulfotelmatobacter sp.]
MTVWSVLIVDDNQTIRKVICQLFTREGDFEVCAEAENGQQAIEKAADLKPALIVTDLSMPVMNGLVATRILRKLMPKVPIILYSSHIDPQVEKEALAAGASAVIPKSDAVALLIERSRRLLWDIAA